MATRADQAAERVAGRVSGRVAVDITKPLNFETFDSLTVADDAGEAIALNWVRCPAPAAVTASAEANRWISEGR